LENRVCLSRGVQVVGAAWRAAMRIMARVGDLVQRTEDGCTSRVLGGWVIERSWLCLKIKVDGLWVVATVSPGLSSKPVDSFLVEPQNQGGGGFSGLGLKTGSSGLVIWASKSPRQFLGLGLKIKWASVCQLRHITDGGWLAWDTRRDLAACFTWKQVCPERLAEAQWRAVHVAPSQRLRRRQVEDWWVNVTGCVGPCYPTFAVFNVLGPRGIVVI
jgi:hypothetical protein